MPGPVAVGPTRGRSGQLRPVERALLGLEVFLLLVSALGGGMNYVLNPQQGNEGVPQVLRGTPFDSFLLPGIALLVCNAAPPLVAVVGTLQRRPWAAGAHVLVGLILMSWIIVQGRSSDSGAGCRCRRSA
jgi:drug/metabolite transporter (DMT)-like permease